VAIVSLEVDAVGIAMVLRVTEGTEVWVKIEEIVREDISELIGADEIGLVRVIDGSEIGVVVADDDPVVIAMVEVLDVVNDSVAAGTELVCIVTEETW